MIPEIKIIDLQKIHFSKYLVCKENNINSTLRLKDYGHYILSKTTIQDKTKFSFHWLPYVYLVHHNILTSLVGFAKMFHVV